MPELQKGESMSLDHKEQKSCTTFVDCLCDIFKKQNMLTHDDIDSLKKDFLYSSIPAFEDFLLEEQLLEKEDLLKALGIFYTTQAIDAQGFFFDHHLVTMFPKDVMLRNMFVPYERDNDVLYLLAANPHNADLAAIVGKYVSYDVVFFVGLARDIDDAIKEYFDNPLYEIEQDTINKEDARREEHPVETMIDELQADEDFD